MMRVLALDTTTRAGSVAIVENDTIVDERSGDAARAHAERLPGDLVAIVEANHIGFRDVDLYAVASGPGSFTGLRIGIATMQGLAFVQQRQTVGVGALQALAHLGARDLSPGAIVAAWMDAHRRDVFAALYRVTDAPVFDPARLEELDPPGVGDPASTLERWAEWRSGSPALFIGDGAVLYTETIVHAMSGARILPPPPIAGAVGRLAIARAQRGGAVNPAGLQPLYVRRPDAEVAREQETQRTQR